MFCIQHYGDVMLYVMSVNQSLDSCDFSGVKYELSVIRDIKSN